MAGTGLGNSTGRHFDDTSQSPSPPSLMSKSSNISQFRIQGNEGVKSGAERDEEGPPSVRKDQKGIMAFEGHENRLETSFNTKPDPTISRAQDVLQHQKLHSEGPIRPIYSPSHGHKYNTSVRHLPDASDSRQKAGWARN